MCVYMCVRIEDVCVSECVNICIRAQICFSEFVSIFKGDSRYVCVRERRDVCACVHEYGHKTGRVICTNHHM